MISLGKGAGSTIVRRLLWWSMSIGFRGCDHNRKRAIEAKTQWNQFIDCANCSSIVTKGKWLTLRSTP